jgi:hypothetical protein
METFIVGVILDNDNNQTTNGFLFDDIVELYEQSIEVMTLQESVS